MAQHMGKKFFSRFFGREDGGKPFSFLKKNFKHRCIYQLQIPEGIGLANHLNFRPVKIRRSFIVLETMRLSLDVAKLNNLQQMHFTVFILENNKKRPIIVCFSTHLLKVLSDSTITIAPPQQFDSISSNKIERFSLENRHHPVISLWSIDKRCANIRLLKMFNPLILYIATANDAENFLVDISSKGLCLALGKITYRTYANQLKRHKEVLLQIVFRNPDMIQEHEFIIICSISYIRPNSQKNLIEVGIQFLYNFTKEPSPVWNECKADGIPELEWLLNEYTNFYLEEIKEKLNELSQTEFSFHNKLLDTDNGMHSSILAQERVSSMNRIAASLCKNLTPTLANLTVTLQYLSTKASDQKESALFSNSIYQLQSIAIKLSNIYAITAAETTPFSSVDIAPLLERTTAIFRAIAQKNNIALTVSIPDSLPSIQGDPDQLHLVFNNLVLNAIEAMSPQGGHLWLSARHDAATQLLLVDVEDTGGGIPGEMRATIFKPYQNIQKQGAGLGLGLPVAQRIIASHGGSIGIQSTLGEGSTVTVRLPCFPDNSTVNRGQPQ